jgi:hypothetical protein
MLACDLLHVRAVAASFCLTCDPMLTTCAVICAAVGGGRLGAESRGWSRGGESGDEQRCGEDDNHPHPGPSGRYVPASQHLPRPRLPAWRAVEGQRGRAGSLQLQRAFPPCLQGWGASRRWRGSWDGQKPLDRGPSPPLCFGEGRDRRLPWWLLPFPVCRDNPVGPS